MKFRCHTLIASLLHIAPDTVKREKIAIGFPVTTFITHDFYPFPAFKVVCRCCDGPLAYMTARRNLFETREAFPSFRVHETHQRNRDDFRACSQCRIGVDRLDQLPSLDQVRQVHGATPGCRAALLKALHSVAVKQPIIPVAPWRCLAILISSLSLQAASLSSHFRCSTLSGTGSRCSR